MSKISLWLLLFLFIIPLTVTAQDDSDNPAPESPEDNECYIGGVMEGKCHTDIDENGIIEDWEINWHWECGWYLARYNNEILSRLEIPVWCQSLLPPLLPDEEGLPPFSVHISSYSLGGGRPCDLTLRIILTSQNPVDLIIYVWNESYDNTLGDPYPTTLQPGRQFFTVTLGGDINPDYFHHIIHIRDTNGNVVSNYIDSRCNVP